MCRKDRGALELDANDISKREHEIRKLLKVVLVSKGNLSRGLSFALIRLETLIRQMFEC